jgi:hypothetical protein
MNIKRSPASERAPDDAGRIIHEPFDVPPGFDPKDEVRPAAPRHTRKTPANSRAQVPQSILLVSRTIGLDTW